MNIESTITISGSTTTQKLSSVKAGAENRSASGATLQNVQGDSAQDVQDIVLINQDLDRANRKQGDTQLPRQKNESFPSEIYQYKAVFAVDDQKNVVIRFVDKKGKVVRQVPPEEYLDMISKLKESTEQLFSTKA
jgi:uncharacterized FlaG/YvyC family protein